MRTEYLFAMLMLVLTIINPFLFIAPFALCIIAAKKGGLEYEEYIRVPRHEYDNIVLLASILNGEDAIAETIRCIDCPGDDMQKSVALAAVTRFYANVKLLTEQIETLINHSN